MAKLAAQDPNLTKLVNPASPLYGSFFSVWVSGFSAEEKVIRPELLREFLASAEKHEIYRQFRRLRSAAEVEAPQRAGRQNSEAPLYLEPGMAARDEDEPETPAGAEVSTGPHRGKD